MSLYLYRVFDNKQFIENLVELPQFSSENGDVNLEIVSPSALRSNTYAQYFNMHDNSEEFRSIKFIQLSKWIANQWKIIDVQKRLIDPALRSIILRKVLSELVTDSRSSQKDKNFYQHEGTLERVLSLIVQHGIVSLQAKYSTSGEEGPKQAVSLIIDKYADNLNDMNYIELQDAMQILKSKLPKSDKISIFVGFSAFGLAEVELIVEASKSKDVLVTIAQSEKDEEHSIGRLLCEGFSRLAEDKKAALIVQDYNGGPLSISEGAQGGQGEQTIANLVHDLFNEEPFQLTSALKQGLIQLCFAEGQGAQDTLMVEKTLELLDNSDSDKIALIVRKSKTNFLRVAQKIEDQGQLIDLDIRIAFEDSQFGITFARLISLISKIESSEAESELGYELIGLLQSPFFGIDSNLRDLYDSRAKKNRYNPRVILADFSNGKCGFKSKVILACMHAFKTKTAESWGDLANSLMEQFLSDINRGRVETIVNTAAHQRILETLSDIASSKPQVGDSARKQKIEANEIVESILGSRLTITEGVGAQSRILLTEAHRIIDRKFDHVIFAELSADEYGRGGKDIQAEASFIYARDAQGVTLDATQHFEIKSLEEKNFFAEVLRSPEKSLVLIAKISDEYGSRQAPSFPLTFFLRESTVHDAIHSEGNFLAESAKLGIQVKYARESDSLRSLLTYGSRDEKDICESPKLPKRGDINARFSLWSTLETQATEVSERPFSPSALERYAKCPYSWLISRYLPSNSLETPIDQRVFGTTVHHLLEEFYKAWSKKFKTNAPRMYEWSETGYAKSHTTIDRDRALDLFDSIQPSDDFLMNHYHKPLLPSDKTKIEEARIAARRRILSDMDCLPTSLPGADSSMFEFTLGGEGTYSRVGGLSIRGQIDRVDLSKVMKSGQPSVLVFDYKGHFDKSVHFIDQLKIQAPIYLLALARENNWKPGGYFYLSYSNYGNIGEFSKEYIYELLEENTNLEPEERQACAAEIKKQTSKFGKGSKELDSDLSETLKETESILEEIRKGLEAGMAPVAIESSLGGRGLSREHKDCKYCLYTACIVKRKAEDSITEIRDESLILSNLEGGNDG